MTAQEILQDWLSSLPEYMQRMFQDTPVALIPFEGMAEAGALAYAYADQMAKGRLAATADSGEYATGQIVLTRSDDTGAASFAAGTVFRNSQFVQVQTTETASFADGDLSKIVAGKAVSMGESGNLPADIPLVFMTGNLQEETQAEWEFATSNAWSGGTEPQLENLGQERGIERQDGEAIDNFRFRVQRLPDRTTEAAIRRAVEKSLRYSLQDTTIDGPAWWYQDGWSLGLVGDYDPADLEVGAEGPGGRRCFPFSIRRSVRFFVVFVYPLPLETTEGQAAAYWLLWNEIKRTKAAGRGFFIVRTAETVIDSGATEMDDGWTVIDSYSLES